MDETVKELKTIAVFGLGYVGVTTAACLAKVGFNIIGVDVDPNKVQSVGSGQSPISEDQIEDLLREGIAAGRLRATTDTVAAIAESDAALVCVGTPSRADGRPDLTALRAVAGQIGKALAAGDHPYTIIVRSTVPPGTTDEVFIPALEAAAGRPIGDDLMVLYHPEFLREGLSVADFMAPPKIVFGTPQPAWADVALQLYATIEAPRFVVALRDSEFVKYMDNPWHALKISFANELGSLAAASGVSANQVFEIFLKDHKLNISERYLRPGFVFGGSCLPKDLRALMAMAREKAVDMPVMDNVLLSNSRHLQRIMDAIADQEAERIGLWGLAFKHGTDDLRESGAIEVAHHLLGRGHEVKIWDSFVAYDKLIGRNKSFADRRISHLASHMVKGPEELLEWADLVVVTTNDPAARTLDRTKFKVLDVSGSFPVERIA